MDIMAVALAAQHPVNRSTRTNVPSFLRFVNTTLSNVAITWLDYVGNKMRYKSLCPGQFVDINSFALHLWICINEANGDVLLAEDSTIYRAKPWVGDRKRVVVHIKYPLYTLRSRALQVMRDNLTSVKAVDELEIPNSIKSDLRILVQKKLSYVRRI